MVDFLTNSFVRVDGVESRDDVAGCSWHMSSSELEELAKGDGTDMQYT